MSFGLRFYALLRSTLTAAEIQPWQSATDSSLSLLVSNHP